MSAQKVKDILIADDNDLVRKYFPMRNVSARRQYQWTILLEISTAIYATKNKHCITSQTFDTFRLSEQTLT